MYKYPPMILAAAAAMFVPLSLIADPDQGQAGKSRSDDSADIPALVQQLSAESFPERERATQEIWKLGSQALPTLKKAAESKDPELAGRASVIALYIDAGVLPDSPDEIKKMVLTFSKSKTNEKISILNKLTEMGHWRQVLHLANKEKNPEARQMMEQLVKKNASQAARDAVAKGDHELAMEVLNLTGDTDAALVSRAWYYTQRGMLDEQFKKAATMPGEKAIRWRLALHRADGNIPAALKEAKKLSNNALTKFLTLQNGDPVPWLEHQINPALIPTVLVGTAQSMQICRLRGEKARADRMARELIEVGKKSNDSPQVILFLAANGYRKEALDLLVKSEPMAAFIYFDNMELPELALDTLGIPRDASPPYTDWVKKTTEQALEEDEDDSYMPLFQVAGFLARRGESEHAAAVITPLMNSLEKDGSDTWFDYLGFMVQLDMGELVLKLIEQRGNEDAEADLAIKHILNNISMQKDSASHLWEALKKRNNEQLGKALHEMAVLTGMIYDSKNEATPLHNALLAEVNQAQDVDHTARLLALHEAADARSDLLASRELLSRLAKRNPELNSKLLRYDLSLMNWGVLEPYYTKQVEENPSSYMNLTNLYIINEKLGKHADKEAMLERILLLSMGEPAALYSIAYRFNHAGMSQQATELWLKALAVSGPEGKYADAIIQYLLLYPDALLSSGQYRLAAALTEANIKTQSQGRSRSIDMKTMLDSQFVATFCRGMHSLQQGKRTLAISQLDAAQALIPGDGTLADQFFPNLLGKGLEKNYNRWFLKNFKIIEKSCQSYPKSHNSHNTLAWLASRSVRKLDAAHEHATKALKERPEQGAYLDTMAEVWFARGDRAKAVEWSEKAVHSTRTRLQGPMRSVYNNFTGYRSLLGQLERFKKGDLPKSK